jgi:hypothetical protein
MDCFVAPLLAMTILRGMVCALRGKARLTYLFISGATIMAEIERVTIALRARDVEELRHRWDAGKDSGLAGEINIRGLIADEKLKKREARRKVEPFANPSSSK